MFWNVYPKLYSVSQWCWSLQDQASLFATWTGDSVSSIISIAENANIPLEFTCLYEYANRVDSVAASIANGQVTCAPPPAIFIFAIRPDDVANYTITSVLQVRAVNDSSVRLFVHIVCRLFIYLPRAKIIEKRKGQSRMVDSFATLYRVGSFSLLVRCLPGSITLFRRRSVVPVISFLASII